jgi:hypothetical protein
MGNADEVLLKITHKNACKTDNKPPYSGPYLEIASFFGFSRIYRYMTTILEKQHSPQTTRRPAQTKGPAH